MNRAFATALLLTFALAPARAEMSLDPARATDIESLEVAAVVVAGV